MYLNTLSLAGASVSNYSCLDHLCFSDQEMHSIAASSQQLPVRVSEPRFDVESVTVGNYVLFAGGSRPGRNGSSLVDLYLVPEPSSLGISVVAIAASLADEKKRQVKLSGRCACARNLYSLQSLAAKNRPDINASGRSPDRGVALSPGVLGQCIVVGVCGDDQRLLRTSRSMW